MRSIPVMLRAALLTAAVLGLAACAAPTALPTPTQDPAVIYTQVAATLYTSLTQSVTPTAIPSQTPTPTDTPEPTSTPLPSATATVGTPVPTATKQIVGDAAKYLYTSPVDGFEIEPNHNFNIEWGLLNVGTTTWKAGQYKLVWVDKEHFTNQTSIPLEKDVKPGEKGIFVLGTFGSEEWITHRTDWQLFNGQGYAVPGSYVFFTYHPK